jgi:hypothetical protein
MLEVAEMEYLGPITEAEYKALMDVKSEVAMRCQNIQTFIDLESHH